MDLKTIAASVVALAGVTGTAVQQFRVSGLGDALTSVTTSRDAVQKTLRDTQDGLVSSAKRQDAALTDLQAQLAQARDEIQRGNTELTQLRTRLEAAQANTLRVADLAEKLCKRTK